MRERQTTPSPALATRSGALVRHRHPNVLQVLAMVLFVLLSFIVWLIHWASKAQRKSNEKGGGER